ncbi:MAG: hypothetical protein IID17_11925, partial [Nitrospinae bacterium]|nr:hypothetical protein [Nitrospinota bacterium]
MLKRVDKPIFGRAFDEDVRVEEIYGRENARDRQRPLAEPGPRCAWTQRVGAQFLDVSPLLANLTLGILLGNAGRESEEMTSSLESLQPVLLTCFFTLAGVALDVERLGVIGLLGGTYFLARAAGKIGGGRIGAQFGGDLPRVRRNVGMALLPQAGLGKQGHAD